MKITNGVKLNFSRKGISTTIGRKGFSINTSSRGTYLNTGIPGTGFYSRRKISKGSNIYSSTNYSSSNRKMFSEADLWAKKKSGYPIYFLMIIVGIISAFFQPIAAVLLLLSAIILLIRWMLTNAGKSTSQIRKARSAWGKMNYGKTLQCLENAYTLYPNPYLIDDIIFQANANKQYDTVLKYLNKGDDNDLNIAFNKAECNYSIRNFNDAAKYYQRVIDFEDSETQKDNLHLKLGISLFNIGEYKESIQALQKVSSNFENKSLLTLLIGQSFSKLDDNQSAIFTFTNYIGRKRNFDDNMIEMCYSLGQIYLNLNDKTKAKFWLNKVYTQDMDYKNISSLLQSI